MSFNSLGSATFFGTSLQDRFFGFTASSNLDDVLADGMLPELIWVTGLKTTATAFFAATIYNIQYSTDIFLGYDKIDLVYGSNLNDFLVYNDGAVKGGFGGFDSVEQFELEGGDDLLDLSARSTGADYEKAVVVNAGNGQDIVIGGAGKDTINGDAGNDVLIGWRGADSISGGQGDDTLYGDDFGFDAIGGDDTLRGGAGDDRLYGGARTDRIEGGDDDDVLYGGLGGDSLFGDAGNDILYGDDPGTNGNDKLDGGSGDDWLYAGGGNDELAGGAGNDLLEGDTGNDFLLGGLDNDRLVGGAGDDTLDGGLNVDTAVFSGLRSQYDLQLLSTGGYTVTDTRAGSPDGTDLVVNVEFLEFSDQTVPIGAPNLPPLITSNGGGDTASISVGENSLPVTTVTANDPETNQTVTFAIAGGADAALFQLNRTTGQLTFLQEPDFEEPRDIGADNLYEVIVAANDGNGGIDTQTLSISVTDRPDSNPPVIVSSGGGPAASLAVAENTVVVVTVTATDPDGTIPSYAIAGGLDAALFTIDAATGVISFLSAPDFENPLDADRNNIYDVIVRASDGRFFDEQALAVEVTDVNETGRTISGSSGNNTITPTATNAALQTSAYNDTVYGLGGNDTIDGGAGADLMYGGVGNDVYFVDAYSDDGVLGNDDQVIELDNAGTDLVNTSLSYALPENVENLTLTGALAVNGSGNALANVINGNNAANILRGGLGNDTLNGNRGDDILEGEEGADTLNAGSGRDTLLGGTGNDKLFGGDDNDELHGGGQNDALQGQAGNDLIFGGVGADILTGGTESDIFLFNPGDSSMNSATYDTITDFTSGTDVIDLSSLTSPLTTSTYAETSIFSNNFADATNAARSAITSGTRVVFVSAATDGWLFYDTNADGTLDQSVLLKTLNTLAQFSEFDVI